MAFYADLISASLLSPTKQSFFIFGQPCFYKVWINIFMGKKMSSFSKWMEAQDKSDVKNVNQDKGILSNIYSQLTLAQDNLVSQFQDLSNILPEAGPLSAAYRTRVLQAIYLILGSIMFGAFAILIGLPTIVLKPSKFVMCLTISSLLASSSVIVRQKPSVFFSDLLKGGIINASPFISLVMSMMATLYVTIFMRKYIYVLAMGGLQVLFMLYYVASFVPGGIRGLQLLLKAAYVVLSAILSPFLFVVKKSLCSIWNQIIS
jgi:hypothetical protein